MSFTIKSKRGTLSYYGYDMYRTTLDDWAEHPDTFTMAAWDEDLEESKKNDGIYYHSSLHRLSIRHSAHKSLLLYCKRSIWDTLTSRGVGPKRFLSKYRI